MFDIQNHLPEIESACADLGVRRLDLFGSATRDELTPSGDVDVLALFDRTKGLLVDRYFDLKERLEQAFGRPVDLVLDDSIRNPYFREAVEASRVNIYEA
ncbi:nucleotidyltransferase domain-containing protein [Candidatus Sumerlaeota bacterium]|nr:nucleotidyltransferase domain-containing protein [Candidatus Sumerlaeota bacterium]